MRNTRGGFTLLELLMVVIIIAILASVALPQYFRVVERSRTGQIFEALASIRSSELRFRAQSITNEYTIAPAALDIGIVTPTAGWNAFTVTGTAANSNVQTTRNGGTYDTVSLGMDLDTGVICAGTALAAAEWNVGVPGTC